MSHRLVEFTFQSLVESLVADLHSPSNSMWLVLRGSSRKRWQWHCSRKLWFFLFQNPISSVHSMDSHHRLFPHVITAQATQLWNQLTFLSLQSYILHLRDEFLRRLTFFSTRALQMLNAGWLLLTPCLAMFLVYWKLLNGFTGVLLPWTLLVNTKEHSLYHSPVSPFDTG